MSKIRNTNGNSWPCEGQYIQDAIDDLTRGTVLVEGPVTLTQHTYLKDGVIVDYAGNEVTMGGNSSFAIVEGTGYYMSDCSVRNAVVHPNPTQTSPLIHLVTPENGSWNNNIRRALFKNIDIVNTGGNNFDAIRLEIKYNNEATKPHLAWNNFENIKMNDVGVGIHLMQTGDRGWTNANYFKNIFIDGFSTMIRFDYPITAQNAANGNVFQSVIGQAKPWSQYGMRNIQKAFNHFDHCLVKDGDLLPNPDWIVHANGIWTYINALYIHDIENNGINTVISSGMPSGPPPEYENFNTYYVYPETGHPFTITESQIAATNLRSNQKAYVRKDFQSPVFQDFHIAFKVNMSRIDTYGWASICLLSALDSTVDAATAAQNLDGIGMHMNHPSETTWYFALKDYASGQTNSLWNYGIPQEYYCIFHRAGTTAYLDIYDADTGQHIKTNQLSGCASTPYRYINALSSKGTGGIQTCDITFKELEITS